MNPERSQKLDEQIELEGVIFRGALVLRLIEECWNDKPAIRPSFKQIIPRLESIYKKFDRSKHWKVKVTTVSVHLLCDWCLYVWFFHIFGHQLIKLFAICFIKIKKHISYVTQVECFCETRLIVKTISRLWFGKWLMWSRYESSWISSTSIMSCWYSISSFKMTWCLSQLACSFIWIVVQELLCWK